MVISVAMSSHLSTVFSTEVGQTCTTTELVSRLSDTRLKVNVEGGFHCRICGRCPRRRTCPGNDPPGCCTANILINDRNGQKHYYLSDFGIAEIVSAGRSLTSAGQIVDTIDYIAPEQIHGSRNVNQKPHTCWLSARLGRRRSCRGKRAVARFVQSRQSRVTDTSRGTVTRSVWTTGAPVFSPPP